MMAISNNGGWWRAMVWVVIAASLYMCICLQSCATTKCLPETIEVHDTLIRVDSVQIERVRDSIVYRDRQDSTYVYEKDSTSERQRGDTLYVTRWKVKYIYKYQSANESVAEREKTASNAKTEHKQTSAQNEVRVKEVRYIPKLYRVAMWWFWICIAILALYIVLWICCKIPACKPYADPVFRLLFRR